jgi:hypothetical protein
MFVLNLTAFSCFLLRNNLNSKKKISNQNPQSYGMVKYLSVIMSVSVAFTKCLCRVTSCTGSKVMAPFEPL